MGRTTYSVDPWDVLPHETDIWAAHHVNAIVPGSGQTGIQKSRQRINSLVGIQRSQDHHVPGCM